MPMFGESPTSLLVVEGNNEEIYHSLKFYSGVLSVICMAHLHFQSEPHHNEDRALTRNKHSNYLYTVMVPVYSMTLIATGMILRTMDPSILIRSYASTTREIFHFL